MVEKDPLGKCDAGNLIFFVLMLVSDLILPLTNPTFVWLAGSVDISRLLISKCVF